MGSPSGKSILITGGLGFIGSHLVQRLKKKFKVIVIDRDRSRNAEALAREFRKTGIQVCQDDIADNQVWNRIEGCDYVFHGAAQISAEESRQQDVMLQDFDTNLRGTFLAAEYARKCRAAIIYCNTIRAYAPEYVEAAVNTGTWVDENFPTILSSRLPQPPFAVSKYFGEQYLRAYAQFHNLKVISHRMSGVMGPGQIGKEIHGWVSYIVKCAVNGHAYTVFGDGSQSRDILHIDDFVDLVEMELLDFDRFCDQSMAVYNIGGGPANRISINDVIKLLEREYQLGLNSSAGDVRQGEPKHYVTCLNKIKKKGWPDKHGLIPTAQIIEELVRWYQGRK